MARLVRQPGRAGDVADGVEARHVGRAVAVDRPRGRGRASRPAPPGPGPRRCRRCRPRRWPRSASSVSALPPASSSTRDAGLGLGQLGDLGADAELRCRASRTPSGRRPRPPRPRPAGCAAAPRSPSPRRPAPGRSWRTRCRWRRSRPPAATSGRPSGPSPRGRSRPARRRAPGRWRGRCAPGRRWPGSPTWRSSVRSPPAFSATTTFGRRIALLQPRRPVDHLDLVLLHQEGDAAGELLGDRARARDHLGEVVGAAPRPTGRSRPGGPAARRPRRTSAAPWSGCSPSSGRCRPALSRSTMAVFRPSWLARMAAT